MPAKYYISPFCPPVWDGETDVYINAEYYEIALKRDWDAKIIAKDLLSYTSILSWELTEGTGLILQGGLDASKKVVFIDGSIYGMAAFAIWHKSLVSKNAPLYLFDEGLNVKFEITGSTKVYEIVEAIEG